MPRRGRAARRPDDRPGPRLTLAERPGGFVWRRDGALGMLSGNVDGALPPTFAEDGCMHRAIVVALTLGVAAVLDPGGAQAQDDRSSPPLPQLPRTLDTSEHRIRVVAIADGLAHPWSIAFLPDGDL